MTQQAAFEATSAAQDITNGLASGCYLAQPRRGTDTDDPAVSYDPELLYATASTPPADLDAWFESRAGAAFSFRVGSGLLPTWVRTNPRRVPPSGVVAVARARTGA